MLRDLKEHYGYYYVDGHFNLNDFIFSIMFAMFSVAFIFIYFFKAINDAEFEFIMMITMPIFLSPFVIYFIYRIIKIILFKRKYKIFSEKGTAMQGRIIGEKKGKPIFEDKVTGIERSFYYPKISIKKGTETFVYDSKFAVNNPYKYALESEYVGVYEYKGDYLIYSVYLAETEYSSINTHGKTTSEDKAIIIINVIVTILMMLFVLLRRILLFH
jgi:hypothetical protein